MPRAEWIRGFECVLCGRLYVGENTHPIRCGDCGSSKPESQGIYGFYKVDIKVKQGWFSREVMEVKQTGMQSIKG